MKTKLLRILAILAFLLLIIGAFGVGTRRLHVEPDITAALPQNDPVIASGRRMLALGGALGNYYVQLSAAGGSAAQAALGHAAEIMERHIRHSGLAEPVAMDAVANLLAALYAQAVREPYYFFDASQLNGPVAERMRPEAVYTALAARLEDMARLGGIGQAQALASDPLNLASLALDRLAGFAAPKGAALKNGCLVSQDGSRLLIIAEPLAGGQDTAAAAAFARVARQAEEEIAAQVPGGPDIQVVWAGAGRAALDNETAIKGDMRRMIALVTAGLVVLMFFSFPRPLFALLALLPALGGVMLAVFFYSLFNRAIFAISMGFGGALVAIAVDHALAYTLHLDRPYPTRASQVSREVWSVSSFTVYTTVAALAAMGLTGAPLLAQVGLFAALGVGLAALLVHVFFPLAAPRVPAARRKPRWRLDLMLPRLADAAGPKTLAVSLAALAALLFLARPGFEADLAKLNTVSPATQAAEEALAQTWGDLQGGLALSLGAPDEAAMWRELERLKPFIQEARAQGVLAGEDLLALALPTPVSAQKNLAAWREFMTPPRVAELEDALQAASQRLGLAEDAFAGFLYRAANPPARAAFSLPRGLWPALGLFKAAGGNGWVFSARLDPGPGYDPDAFIHAATAQGLAVFDGLYFSQHLAVLLNQAFTRMVLIIFGLAAVLLTLLFLDLRLVLAALAPLVFSMAATLTVFRLTGVKLSLPTLMLAPVVAGLGMDYGLYLVRSFQRYESFKRPEASLFLAAIFLGGVSTLIGAGALMTARHGVLRLAGMATFGGIFFALAGALLITAPLVRLLLRPPGPWAEPPRSGLGKRQRRRLVMARFRNLEPTPRLFAFFKLRLDPMFEKLDGLAGQAGRIIDIGCGYGLPAAWIMAGRPQTRFYCLEPEAERVRVARRVLGPGAVVVNGRAQELSADKGPADLVMLIDMLHYLDDAEAARLLETCRQALAEGGGLLLRATIPRPGARARFYRFFETFRLRLGRSTPHYRSQEALKTLLDQAGFKTILAEPSGPGREETWIRADKKPPGPR